MLIPLPSLSLSAPPTHAELFSAYKINMVCTLFLPSPSLTAIPLYTSSSRHTRVNIHRQCKRWSGTDGIRMIEPTYNSSHNFPHPFLSFIQWLSRSFSLPCSCLTLTIVWMHHLSRFNAIQSPSSCQRGSWLLDPHSAAQSQPRGEGEEGGQGEELLSYSYLKPFSAFKHNIFSLLPNLLHDSNLNH